MQPLTLYRISLALYIETMRERRTLGDLIAFGINIGDIRREIGYVLDDLTNAQGCRAYHWIHAVEEMKAREVAAEIMR